MKRMSLLGQVLCLLLEWLITIKLSGFVFVIGMAYYYQTIL